MASVIYFFLPVGVLLFMHVSTWGLCDLLGFTVTLTLARLLSDGLTSDPILSGRWGVSIKAAEDDKRGLEEFPGDSGLHGESWTSAKAQVSFQQVLAVF